MRKDLLKNLSAELERAKDELTQYDGKDIYIFGAGDSAMVYSADFDAEGIRPLAYLDNDKTKQGKKIRGVPILAPDAIRDNRNAIVLICSLRPTVHIAVSPQVRHMGIPCLSLDKYIFAAHSQEILSNVKLLEDDESAEVYSRLIEYRLNPEINMKRGGSSLVPYNPDAHFALPQFCAQSPKEVFVNCGAFVGDTLEEYIRIHIGQFSKIFAFEPTEKSFNAMRVRRNRLVQEWALDDNQITLIHAGVDMTSKTSYLYRGIETISNMVVDKFEDGLYAIKVVALDDYFSEQVISFLDADIEGHEMPMLLGAEKVIRRDKPKMAICIYHSAFDMYRIIQWVNGLNLGYKFDVRKHWRGVDFYDTMLYAYTK